MAYGPPGFHAAHEKFSKTSTHCLSVSRVKNEGGDGDNHEAIILHSGMTLDALTFVDQREA